MPTLTQLEYILAVEEHKNFSRAAAACHVSQPSLSSQVQKLEDEVGFTVFDRSKKPIITTSLGKTLVAQAMKVLQEAKKISEIGAEDGSPNGYFHLGVIPSIAPYLIPLFVEEFSNRYPNVNLKISELKTEDIISQLYDDKLDGGILVTPLYEERITEVPLYYEKFSVFTSESHKLYSNKFVSDKLLDTDHVWLLEEGHCLRSQVLKICSLNKRKNVLSNVSFESGSLETLINLVREGSGYTLLPELSTTHLSSAEIENNLKRFKKPIPTREVSFVYSREHLKQSISEAICQTILESLPGTVSKSQKSNMSIIDI